MIYSFEETNSDLTVELFLLFYFEKGNNSKY